MLTRDFLRYSTVAVRSHGLRSLLTATGIAIGIASVVLLVSIGEGIHRFVLSEFTQFGTNTLSVTPGKTETLGISGAVISNVRPLSLEDAAALSRIPEVEAVLPVVQGNVQVEAGNRTRRGLILGVTDQVAAVWQMEVAKGNFLPHDDVFETRPMVVLGARMRSELFGTNNPIGRVVRIAGERFRVVGIMEEKGQFLGFDLDDTVYIPVARGLAMFNRESLMSIDLLYAAGASELKVEKQVREILTRRHGIEDFTITTQEQMLATLSDILNILTTAVAALGGISLVVGGIGILTIMIISVNERTAEIGLLTALGARSNIVLWFFLGESLILSGLGGVVGLLLGVGGAYALQGALPALPVHVSWFYVVLAELLAVAIGLAAGVAPARRAAGLDPVEALRTE